MNSQHWDEWRTSIAPTWDRVDDQQAESMFQWTTKHGPPNCWTGTTGVAAAMIRMLLAERERLIRLNQEERGKDRCQPADTENRTDAGCLALPEIALTRPDATG